MTDSPLPTYPTSELALPAMGAWPASCHLFSAEQREALLAAEAAGRPLLVRGEPGTGKSQLAQAAAAATGRLFLSVVVDARSESTDLMWRLDAVARLADAQLSVQPGTPSRALELAAYIQPGPLWWAYDYPGAKRLNDASRVAALQPQPHVEAWRPETGCVLLIDEIDKAEADLPNGLLEALGNGRFGVPPLAHTVQRPPGVPAPLVIITTNDERELPAAFMRRCLVLTLTLPADPAGLRAHLATCGALHFPAFASAHPDALQQAAELLVQDRQAAHEAGVYKPGLAEYLDLLRVLDRLGGDPLARLDGLRQFTFRKQPLP